MDALKEGIKAVAVGVSGSKPIPEDLVSPLIQVRIYRYLAMMFLHDFYGFCVMGSRRTIAVLL